MKNAIQRNFFERGAPYLGALAAAFLGTDLILSEAQAAPQTIYKETFVYCTGSLGREAGVETTWAGYMSGMPQGKFSNLKSFSYGSRVIGGSVNSNPRGYAEGYAFWFRPMFGLSILTAEMNFDVKYIATPGSLIKYEQRLSGIDTAGVPNQTQLAFLVDQTWYISQQAARQVRPGLWEPVQVDPSTLLYGTVPYASGLGAQIPTSYGTSLPSGGTVRAFGIFMTEVNGRVRLDNFEIKTSAPVDPSISTAIQSTNVSSCPGTSPDVTGGGGSQTPPPPDEDDSDGSVDQFLPMDPSSPSVDITAPIAPQFCPVSEQGTGSKVRISKLARKAFLKPRRSSTTVSLRDQAIAQILAARVMRVGAVVNLVVGDYDSQARTVRVKSSTMPEGRTIRISGSAKKALDAYLVAVGSGRKPTDPLFVGGAQGSQSLDTMRAACSAEVKSVIARRARAAKISTKSVFVK
jgi:hypothetical protein